MINTKTCNYCGYQFDYSENDEENERAALCPNCTNVKQAPCDYWAEKGLTIKDVEKALGKVGK